MDFKHLTIRYFRTENTFQLETSIISIIMIHLLSRTYKILKFGILEQFDKGQVLISSFDKGCIPLMC